jgi:hypothetical protein
MYINVLLVKQIPQSLYLPIVCLHFHAIFCDCVLYHPQLHSKGLRPHGSVICSCSTEIYREEWIDVLQVATTPVVPYVMHGVLLDRSPQSKDFMLQYHDPMTSHMWKIVNSE